MAASTRVLMLLTILSVAAGAVSAATSPPRFKKPRLTYYVQVDIGGIDASPNFLPALNTSRTANFGQGVLFAFNVTKTIDPKSETLGAVRGYTVETSYVANLTKGLETASIEYNDGTYSGSFAVQGIVGAAGTNEMAIIGGTGSFRGARGYIFVDFASMATPPYYTFRHVARFF